MKFKLEIVEDAVEMNPLATNHVFVCLFLGLFHGNWEFGEIKA